MLSATAAIRRILDAATSDDMASAIEALNEYADNRPETPHTITNVGEDRTGEMMQNFEEIRSVRHLPSPTPLPETDISLKS
jgi:hypothetical protein